MILRVISKIEGRRHHRRPLLGIGTSRRSWALPRAILLVVSLSLVPLACGSNAKPTPGAGGRAIIVVSYPVLGAVVTDLVRDRAEVRVLMGNGTDPHDWSPSAKDIAMVRNADLVVVNGLGLEEGLHAALAEAKATGVPVFEATDHLNIRPLSSAADNQPPKDHLDGDPHFWVDPWSMAAVVEALAAELAATLALDVTASAAALRAELIALDERTQAKTATVPVGRRKLVTGHQSLGYFADRYGFEHIGAVVPSLSSQAETSAAQLARLNEQIRRAGVSVLFTEIGTPAAVARAVANETGTTLVELATHTLPADGKYRTFITELADCIVAALSA